MNGEPCKPISTTSSPVKDAGDLKSVTKASSSNSPSPKIRETKAEWLFRSSGLAFGAKCESAEKAFGPEILKIDSAPTPGAEARATMVSSQLFMKFYWGANWEESWIKIGKKERKNAWH
jgi:hypothetical protein